MHIDEDDLKFKKKKVNAEELAKAQSQLFDRMVEDATKISFKDRISTAELQKIASKKKKGWIKKLQYNASDIEGLLYNLLGEGKVGEAQHRLLEDALLNPYSNAMIKLSVWRTETKKKIRNLNKLRNNNFIIPGRKENTLKMFNLTAYVDNTGTIVVRTLDSYYAAGRGTASGTSPWNIDKYIDVTKSSVNVALPFKEIDFTYKGLGTFLAKQFQQLENTGWGTITYSLENAKYDAPGDSYKVEVPFEHMQYERLEKRVKEKADEELFKETLTKFGELKEIIGTKLSEKLDNFHQGILHNTKTVCLGIYFCFCVYFNIS